jgi:hypothetical protein
MIRSEEVQNNIAASQRQDLWVNQMIQYLEQKELPDDVTRAREILSTSAKFFIDLRTNALYREHQPNPKSNPDIIYEQQVLPSSAVEEVMRQAHDNPYIGAHRGYAKVYWHWPLMCILTKCTQPSRITCQAAKYAPNANIPDGDTDYH